MPTTKCNSCGNTMWSQYMGEGMLHFCKDCGLDKAKPIIARHRERMATHGRRPPMPDARDFPLDPRDPDPRESEG